MNKKDKTSIAVLKTHIKYIKESIDELKESVKKMQDSINRIENDTIKTRENLENHLHQHQRDLTILGIVVSAIAVFMSLLMKLIG